MKIIFKKASLTEEEGTVVGRRVVSVDLFRGLVIAAMIFTNNSGPGMPWWMYHGNAKHGGIITWTDLVWPAFLWITGVAIPFAMSRRIDGGEPVWKTALHILWRGFALIWLGCLLNSWSEYRYDLMGISADWYRVFGFIALLGAFTRWDMSRYPKKSRLFYLIWIYRLSSWLYFIVLTFVVRYGASGATILTLSPWGMKWSLPASVLASFGYAFIWITPLWWLTRKSLAARMGLLGLSALAIIYFNGGGYLLTVLPNIFFSGSIFHTRGFVVLAGTIVGDVLWKAYKGEKINVRLWLILFGFGLMAAAYLSFPKWTWEGSRSNTVLRHGPLCAGICTLFFWLVWEIKRKFAFPFQSPLIALGQNPILAYLMTGPFISIQSFLGIKIRDFYLKDAEGWVVALDPLMWLIVITLSVMWFNKRRLFLKV